VRDSGVGGLTVAREIKKRLPRARLLYFADTAHVPYGDRSPAEVRHFALSISDFLISQGAQLVVFACNTSSAYALQIAKKKFETPLVGMIEPGARAALEANEGRGPIGVLATAATVQSRMYSRWIEGLDESTKCVEIGCPEYVPLVESEQTSTPAARAACEKYLRPLLEAEVKTIVLGCTHYPLLLPVLREVAQEYSDEIRFVDPAQAVACEVAKLFPLDESTPTGSAEIKNADRFFVSGVQDGVRGWIEKLLENPSPQIEAGPVFTPPANL
jgi:glutamate racemase